VTCRVRCADRRPCRSRGGRVYDQGRGAGRCDDGDALRDALHPGPKTWISYSPLFATDDYRADFLEEYRSRTNSIEKGECIETLSRLPDRFSTDL
jgi:hypothetical protein